MNYSEVIQSLKTASLFDLYRLTVVLRHELDNPIRIEAIKNKIQKGDLIEYFSRTTNGLQKATVLEKKLKYLLVKNHCDHLCWNILYYSVNLDETEVDIHPAYREKLSKNHLKIGDCIGFVKDGMDIFVLVIRLNHKTVTLITQKHEQWRVAYGYLFKVIDAEIIRQFDTFELAQWIETER